MEKYIEDWEKENETDLAKMVEKFQKDFGISLSNLGSYFPILYKFYKNSQIKYWNKEIFDFSVSKIKELEGSLGKEIFIQTLLINLDLWISMYESMLSIEERIILMNKFRGSEEMRAKIFTVSIWNDLLNSSYSDALKLYIKFYGEIEGKNQDQKTLTPQIYYLKKREYDKLIDLSDEGIRNAISHGGVRYSGQNKIDFSYTQGNVHNSKSILTFDLKVNLQEIFDSTSAVCLSWIYYLCKTGTSIEKILASDIISDKSKNFFEKIYFSTLNIECTSLYNINIMGDKDRVSFNMEFNHPDLSIIQRYWIGINAALKIFETKNLRANDSVYVSFYSKRTMVSFFRISSLTLSRLISNKINFLQTIEEIGSEQMMWEVNDEIRNDTDDLFRYYEEIETDNYKITEISDISLEDVKRMSAVVYLKNEENKFKTRKIIKEIVEYLKRVENFGNPTTKVKHGKIEADILYLTIYKNEIRRGKSRELYPQNENFISYVQYDINKKFPIKITLVDGLLKKNREGNIEYNWNPNFK